MPNRIILKRSAVGGKIPLPSDLISGEVAINLVDKLLYTRDPLGNVITVGTSANSPILTGIPVAPTAAVSTATTQLATTAFVQAQLANDTVTKTGVGATGSWNINVLGSATSVVGTPLTGATEADLILARIADNDFFRIRVGGTVSDSGWAELATADNGNEPIYVRQYTGVFVTPVRTATLLDNLGNTVFPGNMTSANYSGTHSGTSSGINTGDQTNITGSSGTTAAINIVANTPAVQYIVGVSADGAAQTPVISTANPVVFVAASGNFGVGTIAPVSRLHVVGDARVTGKLFIGNTPGDPIPVITSRTVPVSQGAANEKTELILFHSNDNANSSGVDQITLRAPAISLQTYSNPTVGDMENVLGYNERLYITHNGGLAFGGTANLGITGQVLQSNGDSPPTWVNAAAGGGNVSSVNGLTGVVVLTQSSVGLSNVDNTSDVNKPIGAATQTALNAKQANLGFTAVQQGTGLRQLANVVKIGWTNSQLALTIDATDLGDILTTTSVNTISNKTLTNPAYTAQTLQDAAVINWDMNLGSIAQVTIVGNRTLANPTNMKPGTVILSIIQDATGNRTVTFGSLFKHSGGAAPVLSTVAGARDVLSYFCDGNQLYGGISVRGAA